MSESTRKNIGSFRPTTNDEAGRDAMATEIARRAKAERLTTKIPTVAQYAILAHVVNGASKEEAPYRDRPWFEEAWRIAEESAASVPEGYVIDIPSEF
jgi:hypothetical protein